MSDWVTIATRSELPNGTRRLREIHSHRLALFNLDGQYIAIDNHCSHRHGPVAAGELSGDTITCPWHGLRFNLTSGSCVEPGNLPLKTYQVREQENDIQVDLDSLAITSKDDPSIHQYLIRYGRPGFVGRFGTIHELQCQRGDRVLVATERGEEIGEVLAEPNVSNLQVQPAGEVIRMLSSTETADQQRHSAQNVQVLQTGEALLAAKDVPITLIDAETLFDGVTVILYYLGDAKFELGVLATELAEGCQAERVQFQLSELNSTDDDDDDLEEKSLKGPYERTKYDFRRVWECPKCHHKERTAGSVTSCFCHCTEPQKSGPGIQMKLVEDAPRRV